MSNIVFQAGQFRQYKALRSIHLGPINEYLTANAVFEYDGTQMKWGSRVIDMPLLTGAINAGWIVPIEDNISKYVSQPAGIQVRPAQSNGPERGAVLPTVNTVAEDEVVVGSREATNKKRADALQTDRVVKEAMASSASRAEKKVVEGISFTSETSFDPTPVEEEPVKTVSSFKHNVDVMDEGVPIARLTSPAKRKTVMDDSLSSEMRKLDPVSGATAPKVEKLKVSAEDKPIDTSAKTIATGDVEHAMSGDSLTDILPNAATSGVMAKVPIKWAKEGTAKDRVAKALAEYGTQPEALKQIIQVETPQVQKKLREHLK